MCEIAAGGIDGGNLLGFMAALGALRVLPDTRLTWRWKLGWRPVYVGAFDDENDFCDQLCQALGEAGPAAHFDYADNLGVSLQIFGQVLDECLAVATPAQRDGLDYLSAFAVEVESKGDVQDTALRTMSGAGHLHFLKSIREIRNATSQEQLRSALFEPWTYCDGRPSMRWDPADDRRYALRADDPSKAEIRSVRGANRLAIEALPLFPCVPAGKGVATAGFRDERRLRWPIWSQPIGLDSVRSLLTLPELLALGTKNGNPAVLRARGVVEVFESRRINNGRFRNFTPSVAFIGA